MREELDRIDHRLERIEAKLDNHLERVSKVEASLASAQGQIKLIFTAILTALSAVFTYIFQR